jgi:hypothetical protein
MDTLQRLQHRFAMCPPPLPPRFKRPRWDIPRLPDLRGDYDEEVVRSIRNCPPHFVTTFTPTLMTFSSPISATSYATSTTPSTTVTLDLTVSFGAWLYCRIGRNVGTALTRYAYIGIRRSFNGSSTLRHPANNYDFISSIAAANATTVSSGGAAGATTMVLASGTSYAANQMVLAQLAGARAEWFEIDNLTTATITIDDSAGFLISHSASDVVVNGADVGSVWLPGGDIWRITPVNNSGQTVCMAVDAVRYASDTGT